MSEPTDLLDGRASDDDAWWSSDEGAAWLADVTRPFAIYRALHPHPDRSRGPLLRAMLRAEVATRRSDDDDADEHFELLYWCAFLLASVGEPPDVLAAWRAKHLDFDTACGFDVQFLVGAGVDATLAFLDRSTDPDAPKIADHLRGCRDAGDFDDLDGWRASRAAYFGS
ncbi:MAG: hypothetical protein H6721_27060 [Sandaracinus sp.]|nr:hypothetical protein [Sandaracinus sp.]